MLYKFDHFLQSMNGKWYRNISIFKTFLLCNVYTVSTAVIVEKFDWIESFSSLRNKLTLSPPSWSYRMLFDFVIKCLNCMKFNKSINASAYKVLKKHCIQVFLLNALITM